MRPKRLEQVVGHTELTKEGSVLRSFIDSQEIGGSLPSIILWGPPGCGKTTLARIISIETGYNFIDLTAISSGVKDLRKALAEAENSLLANKGTLLFIDEIHRFNKSQQDALLGAVEKGTISFIGATTENPSFEVNRALLSRATVLKLNSVPTKDIVELISRTINEDELISRFDIELHQPERIATAAAGDCRIALNILELALRMAFKKGSDTLQLTPEIIDKAIAGRARNYDKSDDYHYDNISAFIKSMRGSDPDAAIFWMLNMISGGEDPKFIGRRLLIFASEDIGMADPQSLVIANAAFEAFEKMGLPEGLYPLMQAVVHLSTAPKSNSIKVALGSGKKSVHNNTDPEVPYHLRNGVTEIMKDSGYGKGYKYPHDYDNNFVDEQYLPDNAISDRYYIPQSNELEQKIKDLMTKRWGARYEAGNEAGNEAGIEAGNEDGIEARNEE
jgi:putative ATPase